VKWMVREGRREESKVSRSQPAVLFVSPKNQVHCDFRVR
jgi:hypothetical protein